MINFIKNGPVVKPGYHASLSRTSSRVQIPSGPQIIKMEKFRQKYLKYFKRLPFSYCSTIPYLELIGNVFWRNNKPLLVWQDLFYPHDFPSIFLPNDQINWINCSIALATKEDIEKIKKEKIEIKVQLPVATEYFYSTNSFIHPEHDFRRRVKQFQTTYKYKLKRNYPKEKIIKFYNFWKKQKDRKGDIFQENEDFFYYCLNNFKKYRIKKIYVEVDGKLAGFGWGIIHSNNGWVGLHLEVDYKYKGLSRFLHHERAKLFARQKIFTLGTGAREPGITLYKIELEPILEKEYFYVLTGKKYEV